MNIMSWKFALTFLASSILFVSCSTLIPKESSTKEVAEGVAKISSEIRKVSDGHKATTATPTNITVGTDAQGRPVTTIQVTPQDIQKLKEEFYAAINGSGQSKQAYLAEVSIPEGAKLLLLAGGLLAVGLVIRGGFAWAMKTFPAFRGIVGVTQVGAEKAVDEFRAKMDRQYASDLAIIEDRLKNETNPQLISELRSQESRLNKARGKLGNQ
jgi:hypothetical protein